MIRTLIITLILITFKTEAQSSVLNVADSLMANGNFSKAIKLLENNTTDVTAHKLAKAYDAIGNYDKAILNYKIAVTKNPDNALIKYQYAQLLSKIKKNEEALIVFQSLLEVDNKNANYHYEIGNVLERLNRIDEAQVPFKIAFRIDKTHQKAIFKLGRYSLKKRAFERLDTLITVGLNSYSKNAALISLKAQSLYAQKKYAKSIIWFEKLLELGEKSQFIYEKLSFACKEDIEYDKAISYLNKALQYTPENSGNLFRLGGLYDLTRDYENAVKYIKLALELEDEPLDYEYSKLAGVYNRLKKPQEAVKYYKKALKENPDNESVKFFMLVAKSSYYKDLQSRIDLFETYIEKNPKSNYLTFATHELKKLKTEQFMKVEDNKN